MTKCSKYIAVFAFTILLKHSISYRFNVLKHSQLQLSINVANKYFVHKTKRITKCKFQSMYINKIWITSNESVCYNLISKPSTSLREKDEGLWNDKHSGCTVPSIHIYSPCTVQLLIQVSSQNCIIGKAASVYYSTGTNDVCAAYT